MERELKEESKIEKPYFSRHHYRENFYYFLLIKKKKIRRTKMEALPGRLQRQIACPVLL